MKSRRKVKERGGVIIPGKRRKLTFLLERPGVDLLDSQRYGATDRAAGLRIADVTGPSLRAGHVAKNEVIGPSVRGQLQRHQQGRPKHNALSRQRTYDNNRCYRILLLGF